MTSRIPYFKERADFHIIKAIRQGELPASSDDPAIPGFGAEVLAKCWFAEPLSRPTMTWCSEVLSRRTTDLFSAYRDGEFVQIPREYKSEGHGWRAIHNPDSANQYGFEFTSHFPEILYVFQLYSFNLLTPLPCFLVDPRNISVSSPSLQSVRASPSSGDGITPFPYTTSNRVRNRGELLIQFEGCTGTQ